MGAVENDVVFQVCVYLNSNGFFAYRQGNSAVFDRGSGAFRKPPPFAVSGVPDVVAMRDGRVVFIEAKTKTGVQSDAQLLFEAQCNKHGVTYLLVRSLEDVKKWLNQK